MTPRQLFLQHVGQTSVAPLAINMVKAKGSRMWDADGNEYIDLIAGISVCHIGHCNQDVVEAIKKQADEYLHLMVYGELIENPQVKFAHKLSRWLPANLSSIFFTTGGSEATEGAMKLAKRYTGRTNIISFNRAYHGSTQGALSLMGDESWKQAYRPLLPGISQLRFNHLEDLSFIDTDTACVFAETIQGEAGVQAPSRQWIHALRARCTEMGALLVLDEIQCGFGRTGSLWAFEQYDVVPDILLLGKALGGGMPLGAFIASPEIMKSLTVNPVLGHMNTFGGHPVCCAAGLAAFEVLLNSGMMNDVKRKADLFLSQLVHPKIQHINCQGLMMAVWFDSFETNKVVIDALLQRGVFTDWFLFASEAMRIAPPLNISDDDIITATRAIIQTLNDL
ncbi:MAG: aspartate aminotransferase family protein [Ferruginibacter sp.]|nr:aspartate aminotransferase family protein [Ferruginibacter sp.]